MTEEAFPAHRYPIATYIGFCCREWVLMLGVLGGSCGLCGKRPTYLREDVDTE